MMAFVFFLFLVLLLALFCTIFDERRRSGLHIVVIAVVNVYFSRPRPDGFIQ
jgi:hypothetical protein